MKGNDTKLQIALVCILICSLPLVSCSNVRSSFASVDDASEVRANVGNYYFLPKARVRIKAEKTADGGFTVTVSQFNLPDRTQRYFLQHRTNILADDALVLTVDKNGLLQTMNLDSEDKTPAIIDSVTATVIDVFKVASQTAALEPAPGQGQPAKTFTPFNYVFDPLNKIETDEIKEKMKDKYFQLEVYPYPAPRSGTTATDFKGTSEATSDVAAVHHRESESAVFYRPPTAVEVIIRCKDFDDRMVERIVARVPDQRIVAAISLSRAALIKKTTHLTFIDGDLSGVDFKKPSQALAAVNIPASIAHKAAEAIPEIIKVQDARAIHDETQRKAEIEAQTGLLKSQLALIQAQAALEAVKKQTPQ